MRLPESEQAMPLVRELRSGVKRKRQAFYATPGVPNVRTAMEMRVERRNFENMRLCWTPLAQSPIVSNVRRITRIKVPNSRALLKVQSLTACPIQESPPQAFKTRSMPPARSTLTDLTNLPQIEQATVQYTNLGGIAGLHEDPCFAFTTASRKGNITTLDPNYNTTPARELASELFWRTRSDRSTTFTNATAPANMNCVDATSSDTCTDIHTANNVYESSWDTLRERSKRPRPATDKSTMDRPLRTYPCLHPGCLYVPTRQYHLIRHMKVHSPPGAEDMFDCPGKACFRVGVHGFTRKDHLKEHLVNHHGVRTEDEDLRADRRW